MTEADAAVTESSKEQHGVQSLEVGMRLLRVMTDAGHAMMLRDIAVAAEMSAPKAHRYLVSLIRAGLVEQEPDSARYNLGPFALTLGLAAVNRLDRVQLGLETLTQLRDAINETVALVIWGDRGPVIIRWERPRRPITVNVRTGSTLSLLGTSSGRVFAAWLPRDRVQPLIERELQQRPLPDLTTVADVDALLAGVREQGYAFVRDTNFDRNVIGVAAPVFQFGHAITMALLVVGVEGLSDLGPDSVALRELLTSAQALSLRLGGPAQRRRVPA